jgi:hypothetical protein
MMNDVNGRSTEKIYHFSFAKVIKFSMGRFITGIWSLSPLLGVKIVRLVDSSDLFKISNLVYGGRENCNESVQQLTGTETVYSGYSELARSPFVNVKT